MTYQIKLEVFEGPLDLLLHLIDENQINIYDIPISRITEEYLHYLAEVPILDLESAGEFLLMAATLVHIKSKMLLPKEEIPEGEPEEDPRAFLVEQLLEYKRYKEAALALGERETLQQLVYMRGEDLKPSSSPLGVRLVDLLSAFKEVLQRASQEPILLLPREELDVIDQMTRLLQKLAQESPVSFSSLFERGSRLEVIVTFLALLELLRRGLAKVRQTLPFGEIMVYRGGRS